MVNMENDYFVLYKRDRDGETMKRAKGRMLYDRIKTFATEQDARAYGLSNLQDTPIVAKNVQCLGDYNPQATYVIAAYFTAKYSSSCYDGSSDPVPTHEVVLCRQENLDALVKELAAEGPSRLYLGIEEKLIPIALDRIRSVNGQ